jgi:hypothetical protein
MSRTLVAAIPIIKKIKDNINTHLIAKTILSTEQNTIKSIKNFYIMLNLQMVHFYFGITSCNKYLFNN